MSHFGVLSYGGTGHLNSLSALSRQLMLRGHRVTFFQRPELEARVRQYGLEFSPIGKVRADKNKSSKSGIADLLYRIKRITDEIEMYLREAPDVLIRSGIDALIIDEVALPGPTLAQMLRLPYFLVSTSVPHNFGWSVPRSLSHCDNPISYFSRLQNMLLQVSVFRICGPVRWKLNKHRKQLGLGSIRELQKAFPALAHIATLPECLDFPRQIPRTFHYAGPFVDEHARPSVEFPWNRLDGRPLIYVSLGTARKIQPSTFRIIAEACVGLGLQVVISLGGGRDPKMFEGLPGDPLVVSVAPQLELIKIASIVINHAGINTVLEALMEGKPMVVIPITHDQPALAARLARLTVAEVIPEKMLSTKRLRLAVLKVLCNASYSNVAREIQTKILSTYGLERAVKVIEEELANSIEKSADSAFAGEPFEHIAL
ncbi:glycosyltransferase [Acidicapsa ligni]|uniref:glycosyltransferase n=1 Tax=Acidicapsa ligni TaxID=542300 RepID=UPI0021E075AA|nr:glycosyltransferase [Acidicapsa ligni]